MTHRPARPRHDLERGRAQAGHGRLRAWGRVLLQPQVDRLLEPVPRQIALVIVEEGHPEGGEGVRALEVACRER